MLVMLNHAKSLEISTEDPRLPIVRFERSVHPEFAHGIAARSPVPLKGAAARRARRFLSGVSSPPKPPPTGTALSSQDARWTAGRGMASAFVRRWTILHVGHPGSQTSALRASLPHAEGPGLCLPPACRLSKGLTVEPGHADRGLLTFDGPEPVSLQSEDGVLISVKREWGGLQDGSLCEAVRLPVEGQVEAILGCQRAHSRCSTCRGPD